MSHVSDEGLPSRRLFAIASLMLMLPRCFLILNVRLWSPSCVASASFGAFLTSYPNRPGQWKLVSIRASWAHDRECRLLYNAPILMLQHHPKVSYARPPQQLLSLPPLPIRDIQPIQPLHLPTNPHHQSPIKQSPAIPLIRQRLSELPIKLGPFCLCWFGQGQSGRLADAAIGRLL